MFNAIVIIILGLTAMLNESASSMTICFCNAKDVNLCENCSKIYDCLENMEIEINTSDTEILFYSSTATLKSTTIIATDICNLTITSALNKTRVTCDNFSGFHLNNVSSVTIQFIELLECGRVFNFSQKTNDLVFASLLIENSADVVLTDVSFTNCKGSGLIMLNVAGYSKLEHCSFNNCTHNSSLDAGGTNSLVYYTGAAHIELTFCGWQSYKSLGEKIVPCRNLETIENSQLNISGCDFINNSAMDDSVRGGGLFIMISGDSSRNSIKLEHSNFSKNGAYIGGGLYLALEHSVSHNSIEVSNTKFDSNWSNKAGGGVLVAYFFKQPLPANNSVRFLGCEFSDNEAEISGGVSLISNSSPNKTVFTSNSINFSDCTWIKNVATYLGAAVEVSPAYIDSLNGKLTLNEWFVRIILSNSNFTANIFSTENNSENLQSGIVYITKIPVTFMGSIIFDSNHGTALSISSSIANFSAGSYIMFTNNQASPDGSALNLLSGSAIKVRENSLFVFHNNRACAGAAIQQHSINPDNIVYSKSCYIQYEGINFTYIHERNVTFIFDGNTANCTGFGNSVHVTSFNPCNFKYTNGTSECQPQFTNRSIFNCVANFSFEYTDKVEVSTAARKIVVEEGSKKIVPGQVVTLPVHAEDELMNTVPGIYKVSATGNAEVDEAYKFVTERKTKLHGKPGSTATLHIQLFRISRNLVKENIKVTLDQCPPGYVLKNETTCICSTYFEPNYKCITECKESLNTVRLEQNWWMGIDQECIDETKNMYDEDRLVYGYCPKNHCYNNELNRYLEKNLDDHLICHPKRKGKLCSQCRENYTAYYHSNSYKCESTRSCRYGWLLYLISELLPVTCLFILIIIFNIKLTAGTVNGFIFFVQTVHKILLHDASSYFFTSKFMKVLVDGYTVIVQIFNLIFFQLDNTSYCLWKGAQTLDMIAFRYVTTLYTLLLVISIVLATHYCNARHFKGVLSKIPKNSITVKNTLLHGISGFLVLSYYEATRTSINLLRSEPLYSKGHVVQCSVVHYNGEMIHLRGTHLFYAIPAIFILSTLGLIPPILLIVYPLCYKILTLLRLNETKFSTLLCTLIPLEKMKPLFDSFQSSFKDKFRFFSGLYFLLRLSTFVIQATVPESDNTTYFYAAISIQSAFIFTLHSLCRPYKNKWDNILEGIFLFDLMLISMTFATINIHSNNARNKTLLLIQVALLYLPLIIMAVYTGKSVWKKIRRCKRSTRTTTKDELKYRRFSDSIIFTEAEDRLNE